MVLAETSVCRVRTDRLTKEYKLSNGFAVIPVGSRSNADAVRVPKTAELVARQIRNAIIRGELKDGDTLPAEAQLISEFEVSR